MEIQLEEHITRTVVITLKGQVNAFTIPELRATKERLLAEGVSRFVIDLHEVAFLDSAGLSVLVSLLKQARQSGGDVVLISPSEAEARRILTLTRFDQVFRMFESIPEALGQL